jgi:hypothetical protein
MQRKKDLFKKYRILLTVTVHFCKGFLVVDFPVNFQVSLQGDKLEEVDVTHETTVAKGVPRGDAQDARASPPPPLCIPPPPQPERLVMRKGGGSAKNVHPPGKS